jgi:hypothetical protein
VIAAVHETCTPDLAGTGYVRTTISARFDDINQHLAHYPDFECILAQSMIGWLLAFFGARRLLHGSYFNV